MTLIESLSPSRQQLLRQLDGEIEKVERFYVLRERDAKAHSAKLCRQTDMFLIHHGLHRAERLREEVRGWLRAKHRISEMLLKLTIGTSRSDIANSDIRPTRFDPESGREEAQDPKTQDENRVVLSRLALPSLLGDYNRAQRKLKRMLREHYRALEALNNYRVCLSFVYVM